MRGIVLSLFLVCLVFLTKTDFVCAADTAAAPADVRIDAQEGGGYLVTAPAYRARIGNDGNLHSFIVNGIEFIDDQIAGSLGASFFVEQPIILPTLTLKPQQITATNDVYTIRYRCEPGSFRIYLKHSNPKGAAYVVVCSEKLAFVADMTTETVATVPADYQWNDVQVTVPTGEYLKFQYGSRIWGREINRQVWERSNIAPNKEIELVITPGRDKPPAPGLDQLASLSVTMSHADQLIPADEPVALHTRFDNNSNQLVTTEMVVRVESSHGTVVMDERKPLVCEPHKSVTLPWTLIPPSPGFYRIACSANLDGAIKTFSTTFGYNIAAIAHPVQRPADFTAYWEHVMAEAKAADLQITQIPDLRRSTGSVKVFELVAEENGVRLFSGWLSVPRFPGRYPGLLILPADRATIITHTPALAERGFVVLCVDPTGQESINAALRPLIAVASTNFANKANFGMRAIMVRCLQAVTALASVKEVDPNRVAVTGYGLGGGMALLLAALDERIQAAAPDVPYYCHIALDSMRPDWPYGEVTEYLQANPAHRDAVMNTLQYFDVANVAESITCPVLISVGINDTYSRPENILGVYNKIAGPRKIMIYQAGHEGGNRAHQYEKLRWLTGMLGGPEPEIVAPVLPPAPPAGTAVPPTAIPENVAPPAQPAPVVVPEGNPNT